MDEATLCVDLDATFYFWDEVVAPGRSSRGRHLLGQQADRVPSRRLVPLEGDSVNPASHLGDPLSMMDESRWIRCYAHAVAAHQLTEGAIEIKDSVPHAAVVNLLRRAEHLVRHHVLAGIDCAPPDSRESVAQDAANMLEIAIQDPEAIEDAVLASQEMVRIYSGLIEG